MQLINYYTSVIIIESLKSKFIFINYAFTCHIILKIIGRQLKIIYFNICIVIMMWFKNNGKKLICKSLINTTRCIILKKINNNCS